MAEEAAPLHGIKSIDERLRPLASDFVDHAGYVRVLLLVSPT